MELIRDQSIIAGYLTDASNTKGHAEALIRPRNAEEVAEIVTQCQQSALPLTITAFRTSTTGGPVPAGGWLMSTEHLNRILGPDHVEGGIILGEHQNTLEQESLHFPPDPTSRHECSIGASIACNASGARSFRYGPTRPWIRGLEVVLPTGEICTITRDTPLPDQWPAPSWSPPPVKHAAGYHPTHNLLDLMIGQEGTLGVITKARLRLTQRPLGRLSMIIFFRNLDATLEFVAAARQHATRPSGNLDDENQLLQTSDLDGLNPSAIEFFDHNALGMVRARVPGVPDAAHSALFIEIEHDGEPPIESWWEALMEHDALLDDIIVAEDDAGRAKLQAVRHAIPAGINEQVVQNGMPKISTDFSVPNSALPAMMEAYEKVPLTHITFGHIGDNHLHVNMLPTTPEELTQAKGIYRDLAHQAISLGGTVSAEHGIGKIKKELLADLVGKDVLTQFQDLKTKADPNWVLGRGTLLAGPV